MKLICLLITVLALFQMIWPSNTFVSIYQNVLASERLPENPMYYYDGAGVDAKEFNQRDLSGGYAGHMLIPTAYYENYALGQAATTDNESTTRIQAIPGAAAGSSNTLEYTARFICGTITGEDGPLRPGRYNSDINIFNRQNFPISFFWKATLNGDNRDHNYRIQNLDQSRSTSIDCRQILASIPQLANVSSERYFEGVLTISVDLDPSIRSAISSSKGGIAGVISGSEATSVLSVDAIYTVNALKVASREIILQLIEYSINNQSKKIPSEMVSKVLSIAIPIRTNETMNPDKQIRTTLMREFSLTPVEAAGLNITIKGLSLGVGALDDNHALSLERVNPYQPPS